MGLHQAPIPWARRLVLQGGFRKCVHGASGNQGVSCLSQTFGSRSVKSCGARRPGLDWARRGRLLGMEARNLCF